MDNLLIKRACWAGLILCPALAVAEERAAMAFPGADWVRAEPAEAGVDPQRLSSALEYLAGVCGTDGISQVALIRHGRMIWSGPHIDSVHNVFSCTKSFTSLVAGLLIGEGKLGLDTRLADIVPEYGLLYPDLTVEHALSLTDGYEGDALQPWLPREPRFAPGTRFHYGNAIALAPLGRVLTRVAGEPLEDLFRRRIAEPIGYRRSLAWGDWGVVDGQRLNGTSGAAYKGVFTCARELARLGHLLLNEGQWNGEQLIDADYLRAATRPQAGADTPLHNPDAWYASIQGAYGYLFWVNGIRPDGKRIWPDAPPRTFAIQGNHNNVCFVVPEWGMVLVRMGTDAVIPMERYDAFLAGVGQAILGERK